MKTNKTEHLAFNASA